MTIQTPIIKKINTSISMISMTIIITKKNTNLLEMNIQTTTVIIMIVETTTMAKKIEREVKENTMTTKMTTIVAAPIRIARGAITPIKIKILKNRKKNF